MHFFKSRLSGILAVCLVISYSCNSPEYLSEVALSKYVVDSDDFSKSVTSNDVQIKVTYRPVDLLVAQELKSKETPSAEEIAEVRKKYSQQYYFIVSFSNSGNDILTASAVGMDHFSELLQTISFRMTEVVNLTTAAQDTIPVSDYIYNRTFGMSSSTDLLFAFDKSRSQDQEWIQINLDEFGLGTGKQSLRFKTRDLENVPRIFKL